MLSNSQELIELVLNQNQEFDEFYSKNTGTFKKFGEIRDLHYKEIEKLLKKRFFLGSLRYKDDEFFNKKYLIYQFKDFILNINEFGIFNKSKYVEEIEFPKITIRFDGIYPPNIEIENTTFETFKNNLSMYSFIQGYNQMFNNFQQKFKRKDIKNEI